MAMTSTRRKISRKYPACSKTTARSDFDVLTTRNARLQLYNQTLHFLCGFSECVYHDRTGIELRPAREIELILRLPLHISTPMLDTPLPIHSLQLSMRKTGT